MQGIILARKAALVLSIFPILLVNISARAHSFRGPFAMHSILLSYLHYVFVPLIGLNLPSQVEVES